MQVGAFEHHFGRQAPPLWLPDAFFPDVCRMWADIHESWEGPPWYDCQNPQLGWVRNAHWNETVITVPEALYYLRAFRYTPNE